VPTATFVLVGAGALGRAFATLLAASGHRVVLAGRGAAVARLLESGRIRVHGVVESSAPVRAGPVRAEPAQAGASGTGLPEPGVVTVAAMGDELPRGAAVLFTTKAHQLAAAARAAARSWPHSGDPEAWTAGLQNGVLTGDQLSEAFGPKRVVGASTVLGARRADDGTVVTSLGRTYFGELGGGSSDRVTAVVRAFGEAGLPCEAAADIDGVLWAKMCNAVGVFGVSALTGLPTSQIMATPALVRAYRALIGEAALVASATGVSIADHPDLPMRTYLDLSPDDLAKRLTAGRRAPDPSAPQNFSSMAQDLAAGRPTEYEQIFGDLLRRARLLGVQIPRVGLVYDLVAGLDAGSASRPGPG
jgi:2-dehydropantoate 2-reductase